MAAPNRQRSGLEEVGRRGHRVRPSYFWGVHPSGVTVARPLHPGSLALFATLQCNSRGNVHNITHEPNPVVTLQTLHGFHPLPTRVASCAAGTLQRVRKSRFCVFEGIMYI